MRRFVALMLSLPLTACSGDDRGPLDVNFGETTIVVVVNPVINDANAVSLPAPGTARGVRIAVDDGPSLDADARGIAVLSPVVAGTRTLSPSGSGVTGSATVTIREADLHEVALATDGNGTAVMSDVAFPFGGTVVEVTPDTPLSEVNNALARSNIVVFFHGGRYEGDLMFSGSDVTLFGAGFRGGQVILAGNISMPGSSNRIRGATILGDLSVSGSSGSVSFSRLEGTAVLSGSSTTLLHNDLCGTVTVAGSGLVMLDNAGLAPLARPSDC
jgi:hypothetical protein